MALLSGFYDRLLDGALPSCIAMCCMTFATFGPNSTIYTLPAELFPAHFRCTCNGLCGAFGKLGAIVGATGFLYASQTPTASPAGIGLQRALGILAATNFIGPVLTVGGIVCCLLRWDARHIPLTIGESDSDARYSGWRRAALQILLE